MSEFDKKVHNLRIEMLKQKMSLLEDYLDDLYIKVTNHCNISEHHKDMKDIIEQAREVINSSTQADSTESVS